MVSHKNLGGLEISIGKGGLRFKRRPGPYAACIGAKMEGTSHAKLPPGAGGRYDVSFQDAFVNAGKSCGGNIRKPMPSSRRKAAAPTRRRAASE